MPHYLKVNIIIFYKYLIYMIIQYLVALHKKHFLIRLMLWFFIIC